MNKIELWDAFQEMSQGITELDKFVDQQLIHVIAKRGKHISY